MSALVRAELLSLRTLRSTYIVAAALLALTVGLAFGDLSEIGRPTMDSPAELREPMVVGAGIIAAVFAAFLAAVRVGGEYRYATITHRLLAAPQRERFLLSRLTVYGSLGAITAAIVYGIAAAITVPYVGGEHLSLGLDAAHAVRLLGEVMLSGALASMLGVAVGVLTRSQTAAVMVLGGWFIVERSLGDIVGEVTRFLPSSAMDALVEDQGAALSPGVAAIALATGAAIVTTAAALLLRRRDVG